MSYLCDLTVTRLEIMQNQIVNTKTETVMLYPLKSGKNNLKFKNTMSEFYEHNSQLFFVGQLQNTSVKE